MPTPKYPKPAIRVVPRDDAKKTGCAWCPLAAYATDFPAVMGNTQYRLDKDKILGAGERHTVEHRLIEDKWTPCDILIIQDAADREDCATGVMGMGGSNQFLMECLEAALPNMNNSDIGFAYTVRCSTPRSKEPSATMRKACGSRLIEEIKTRMPKVLVALDKGPLEFLTGETSVNAMAGRVMKSTRPEFQALPTVVNYSAFYVKRLGAKEKTDAFIEAFREAARCLNNDQRQMRGLGTVDVLEDAEQIEQWANYFAENNMKVAVDTETGSLDFWDTLYPGVLCFSFSGGNEHSIVIPWDHPESVFRATGPNADQRPRVLEALRTILTDPRIQRIGQNEKFDRKHIRHSLGFEIPRFERDTYLTHILIDERHGTHGLKTLTYEYTSAGGYEKELDDYKARNPAADPERGGSYANIPGSILFKYAGYDADFTWFIDGELEKHPEYVKHPRLQAYANFLLPKLSEVLGDMEYVGAKVDLEAVKALHVTWVDKLNTLERQIESDQRVREFEEKERQAELAVIPTLAAKSPKLLEKKIATVYKNAAKIKFNAASPKQLKKVLWGGYGLKPLGLTDTGKDKLKARQQAEWEAEGRPRGRKSPMNGYIEAAIENKEWEMFSTDGEVLQQYAREGNDLSKLLIEHRGDSKIVSAFIEPLKTFVDAETLIHTNFKIGGATTGRLASENPNCFSGDTQVLTKQGWVTFESYDGISPVAQWDNGKVSFVSPSAWIVRPPSEPLVQLCNEHIFLKVTQDHRCLLRQRKTGELRVFPASEYPEDWQQLHGGMFTDGDGLLTPAQVRLLVATQADGSYTKYGIDFSFTKATKATRLAMLFRAEGITFTEKVTQLKGKARVRFFVTHREVPYLRDLLGDNKNFGPWVLDLSPDSLKAFVEEVWHWDGCFTRKNDYVNTHEVSVDWVQTAFALSGQRAYKRLRIDEPAWSVYVTPRDYSLTTNIKRSVLDPQITYCVSVPSSYILVRCEGRVMVTGQCQQIPSGKGGGQMKTPFISRFGNEGLILNIDYSQIELRVAASMYKDQSMLEAYINKRDLHTDTGIGIAKTLGIVYEALNDKDKKKYRSVAKTTNFAIIYGAQASTILAQLKKIGLFLELEEVETMLEAFYDLRHQLMAGMKQTEAFLEEKGYVVSPLGTMRRIPEVTSADEYIRSRAIRQGGNFGVQCAAAHMTLIAACAIWDEMRRREYTSRLIMNVHDSLVFDTNIYEAVELATMAKNIMENVMTHSEPYLPGTDWSWLLCPIVAECEIGYSYGTTVGFDPTDLDRTDKKPLFYTDDKGETAMRTPCNLDELAQAMAHEHAA